MRRFLTAPPRVVRRLALFALAAGILLGVPSLAVADPITIDVTNNANQSPVFATFTDPSLASPSVWNEFQWSGRAYPVLGGHTSNKSLAVVHVFAPVPNGRYLVYANLYGQPGNSYRYYYSYQSGNPTAYGVNVGPQADCAEVALTPVTVTDGQFDLYIQRADITSGPENYFAWAWVRLVPDTAPVTSTPASSAWSVWLLLAAGGVLATKGVRRLAKASS